jgi:hypothetical protein
MGFLVQTDSDTLIPHIPRFPGTPGRQPGAGCHQRRVTGGYCELLLPGYQAAWVLSQLAFRVMVWAASPVPACKVPAAGS